MVREELLSLLGPTALAAFESAKRLASTHGGTVSPLHVVFGAVGEAPASDNRTDLLSQISDVLAGRFSGNADAVVIPRETQDLLLQASALARSEGDKLVAIHHLIRAALFSSLLNEIARGCPDLDSDLAEFCSTLENGQRQKGRSTAASSGPDAPLTGVLNEFCIDLAAEARQRSSHPFIGREREITAVLETLCRKLKNNPLLIGKPGVGKTALVAAVASQLLQGRVPQRLRGKRILEVSRLRLLADAKYAGETEERLRQLLDEVLAAGNLILFIDEIHTLLNAGGATGTGDVANLLKSALSKGELTCVGATTLSEYYKYVARDEALARRFSTITIEEPSVGETRLILENTRGSFESHHEVIIDDEAVALIVEMADRYLPGRSFPDKAFDLMDKAAAKVAMAGRDRLTRDEVAGTLSEMTGLPLDIMEQDPAERLDLIEEFLNKEVPGQTRAVHEVTRLIRIAKLRLEVRPERPDGVFVFTGPEGVGKRELATALARFLFGSESKMIEFDMSQFAEHWALSRLVGAEPGYVGYGDRSGLLAKALQDNPHSILYFRNIDLAHAVTQEFLAETFDQGRFVDATGAIISLSNATVIMSLSRSCESPRQAHMGFARPEEDEQRREGAWWSGASLSEALASAVDEVIEFKMLDRDATQRIIEERLQAVKNRIEETQPVSVELDPELVRFFYDRLSAQRKGVMALDRLLHESIMLPFAQLRFKRESDSKSPGSRTKLTARVENNAVSIQVGGSG